MSISLFHLLFGLLIFLSILPAVGCMPSPSFVEPEVGWFARALTSVVAAVVGASIAGEPSAAEPSINVAPTDNSIPPSPVDNLNDSSSTTNDSTTIHPNPPRKRRRRQKSIAINQKKSTYDYAGTKEALGLHPSCNFQSVVAATMTQSDPLPPTLTPPPLPTSPSEAFVERLNKKMTTQTARDRTEIDKLKENNALQSERDTTTIAKLKEDCASQMERDRIKVAKLKANHASRSERDKTKIAQLKEDRCLDKRMIGNQTKQEKIQTAETKSLQQAAKKKAKESLKQISTLEASAMKDGEKIEKLEKGRHVDRTRIETLKNDKNILAQKLKDEKK